MEKNVDYILEKIKNENDNFKKHLLFSVWISEKLKDKGLSLPIIVGGSALEIYISPFYVSGDIDFVFSNRNAFEETIFSTGLFKKLGKNYISENLGLFIEIVDDELHGSFEKIKEIEVDIEGQIYKINVIGLEDLIIDRLNACVHWNSKSDCEMVKILLNSYKNELDFKYLLKKAEEELTLDRLKNFLKELEIEN